MGFFGAIFLIIAFILRWGCAIAFWPCVYLLIRAAVREGMESVSSKSDSFETAEEAVSGTAEETTSATTDNAGNGETDGSGKSISEDIPIGIPFAVVMGYSLYLLIKIGLL